MGRLATEWQRAGRVRGLTGVAGLTAANRVSTPTSGSAANTGVPLLTIMTNNRVYYNDVEHQEKVAIHRGRPVENKLVGMEMAKPPVDFANLARSFSLHGEGPITEPEQIRPAVERAIKVIKEEKRPALVDVYMQHV